MTTVSVATAICALVAAALVIRTARARNRHGHREAEAIVAICGPRRIKQMVANEGQSEAKKARDAGRQSVTSATASAPSRHAHAHEGTPKCHLERLLSRVRAWMRR